MLKRTVLGVLCSLAFASGALAQEGRYDIKPAGDGFIKLDKKTGGLTHCRQLDQNWTCKALNDESKELSASVEDLLADAAKIKQENRELKAKVAKLEDKLAKLEANPKELKLPSDEDVDKIMGFFEKLMQRFLDFARQVQEKNQGEPT